MSAALVESVVPLLATRPPAIALPGFPGRARLSVDGARLALEHALERSNGEPIPRPLVLSATLPAGFVEAEAWFDGVIAELELVRPLLADDRIVAGITVSATHDSALAERYVTALGELAGTRLRFGGATSSIDVASGVDTIALGPGAIGRVDRLLVENLDGPRWLDEIEARRLPTARTRALGEHEWLAAEFLSLLVDRGRVVHAAFRNDYPIDPETWFAAGLEALAPLAAAGEIAIDTVGVTLLSDSDALRAEVVARFGAAEAARGATVIAFVGRSERETHCPSSPRAGRSDAGD